MLEALDLAAHRGPARLFEGLSFALLPGRALVVTGANGTGKTTLLRILAGLTHPAAGEVRWNGRPVAPFDARLRTSLAFVGHAPALKDELTTEENLDALVTLAGETASRDAIRAALDQVALGSKRTLPARLLSQGQRRRIGLARLSLVKRTLWVLDEPATALDAEGVALLADKVNAHLDRGGLAVAATHVPLAISPARVQSAALG